MATATPKKTKTETISIKDMNREVLAISIRGVGPYMQNSMSGRVIRELMEKMRKGGAAKNTRNRPPRDFEADCEAAKHISTEGWIGIPCAAFRNAMISACRVCGVKMTMAKLTIFTEADGFDAADGRGLVRLLGEPKMDVSPVRNATGVMDIRARPRFDSWSATVRIRFDADQFNAESVVNLLSRAGQQVGIGEGRPDSKSSNGQEIGFFEVTGVQSVTTD
jgi:hypothetical protein